MYLYNKLNNVLIVIKIRILRCEMIKIILIDDDLLILGI